MDVVLNLCKNIKKIITFRVEHVMQISKGNFHFVSLKALALCKFNAKAFRDAYQDYRVLALCYYRKSTTDFSCCAFIWHHCMLSTDALDAYYNICADLPISLLHVNIEHSNVGRENCARIMFFDQQRSCHSIRRVSFLTTIRECVREKTKKLFFCENQTEFNKHTQNNDLIQ